ncbi:hypothetical protein H1C71_017008 [Ictidomys tridecemlineatus]|nr:hypothetical protein H1C71_017008 [Ictidomys tridecemlineatus]
MPDRTVTAWLLSDFTCTQVGTDVLTGMALPTIRFQKAPRKQRGDREPKRKELDMPWPGCRTWAKVLQDLSFVPAELSFPVGKMISGEEKVRCRSRARPPAYVNEEKQEVEHAVLKIPSFL